MGHEALNILAPGGGECLDPKIKAAYHMGMEKGKECCEASKVGADYQGYGKGYGDKGRGYFLCKGFGVWFLWFLIFSIVTWIVLFSLQPSFILKNQNGLPIVDTGKLLLYSIIIGLIITLIIWLLFSCCGW